MRAARAAFAAWAERPFEERERIVRDFAALLEKNKDNLARAIGRETGKPLWETRTEVATMVGKIDISVRAYHARTGSHETHSGTLTQALRHRPQLRQAVTLTPHPPPIPKGRKATSRP